MKTRFEYAATIHVPTTDKQSNLRFDAELRSLGDAGFEMVAACYVPAGAAGFIQMFFKRQKESADDFDFG